MHLTYDSFRLIHTRNVFDPDRRPVRPVAGTPAPVATRADYTALTGTLLSAEKSYAFFSGSRPEFNRVLTVREKIANATITGITSANIEIERDGKHTTVAVGQTVPLDNQTAPGMPPAEVPAATAAVSTNNPLARLLCYRRHHGYDDRDHFTPAGGRWCHFHRLQRSSSQPR